MGIITNVKGFLNTALDTGKNTLAAGAALSSSQMKAVEEKRNDYFNELYKIDEESGSIINKSLGTAGIEIYQVYLEQLKTLYKPLQISWKENWDLNCISYFDITKLVTDPEEKNLDKLVNVYQTLRDEECNIALIYNRTKDKCRVIMGVANTGDDTNPPIIATYYDRLVNAMKGNFPGVEIQPSEGGKIRRGIPDILKRSIINGENEKKVSSVAVVSNLASERTENFISQSMEKLLDGIVPKDDTEEYTLVLLAEPLRNNLEEQNRLFQLYSEMTPYASWQRNISCQEGTTYTGNATVAVRAGMQKGKGNTIGASGEGMQASRTKNSSMNFGVDYSQSAGVSVAVSENTGIIQNNTNYAVQHTIELLDSQMKRLEESSALGAWNFAAYVISGSAVIANNVAHMYLALTQGDQSFLTKASVNLWDGEEESDETSMILKNVQRLQHPVFGLNKGLEGGEQDFLMYPTLVTPSVLLSGKELARSLNLPRKSVRGFTVFESAAFGREVQTFRERESLKDSRISIGNIYHMRRCEQNTVNLDIDSLTSHTFITGSTGTGKSNAIYQIINKLKNLKTRDVKVLVVEPAKGEYKKVFGGSFDVYGTNKKKSELLRINPFSFPEEIHVLEHIDRLVEIFNACWPMYAAMPAVLKDAIEKTYESIGWNLEYSWCMPRVFPTFADLLKILPEVISLSAYSSDTKSDYTGALVTRVNSLTNGINGQILCSSQELADKDLFEKDVIVDLSRVGSGETKALLMGILVMKLQEYRMNLDKMNSELIHITVLEEAHNLLRRTSTDQSQESANLQGKSVEMLTNAIAEMRSYGEGFIIADQAPSLLDEAVIRNTNTKIVLRLPDENDRMLVGTSMALREDQIKELSKLPMGVAAVYQNDWVEAVLCQFKEYTEIDPLKYEYNPEIKVLEKFFGKIFESSDLYELNGEDVDILTNWIRNLQCSEETKEILKSSISGEIQEEDKGIIAYNLFHAKDLARILNDFKDEEKGVEKVKEKIKTMYALDNENIINQVFRIILLEMQLIGENELTERYAAYVESGVM